MIYRFTCFSILTLVNILFQFGIPVFGQQHPNVIVILSDVGRAALWMSSDVLRNVNIPK